MTPAIKRKNIIKDGSVAGFAGAVLALSLGAAPLPALSATIDILWYTYSDPLSIYRSELLKVAAQAATDPLAHGNNWNITWWQAGTPIPDLTGYEVLVTHSGEGFTAGAPDAPPPGYLLPDFTTLLQSGAAIQAARGDRTAVVATDLDFHSVVRASGVNTAAGCDPHGQAPQCDFYDGARGALTNLIDWAGSGQGLGVVALFDGEFLPGGYWWDKAGSFLKDELQGSAFPLRLNGLLRENFPVLTAAEAALPLNEHLTSEGLSNWTWSYHGVFQTLPTGYVSALESSRLNLPVVLVSAATANLGLTPAVPEPAQAWLLLGGMAALVFARRWQSRAKAVV